MVQDNGGKRIKLQEELAVLSTSLIKSKIRINKPSNEIQPSHKKDLDVSSTLLSDHLLKVQQEVNTWISLHIND